MLSSLINNIPAPPTRRRHGENDGLGRLVLTDSLQLSKKNHDEASSNAGIIFSKPFHGRQDVPPSLKSHL